MIKELICINCPMGCHLQLNIEQDEVIEVKGNTCPRGLVYAKNEFYHPMRRLSSTVKIKDGLHGVLPVISSDVIPKEKCFEVLKLLKEIEVEAPIVMDQIIVNDVLGLGVDILASRDMGKVKDEV